MPTFGVVVEGEYDEETLGELIGRIIETEVHIVARICGSKSSLMKKFPVFLEDFRWVRRGTSVDKAIVVRDADQKVPQQLYQTMQQKIQNRTYPFPVKFVIIVQELEAWLLADHDAISKVTEKMVPRVNESLEDIDKPKVRLTEILTRVGVPYTKKVAGQIAAVASLQRLSYRCPSFSVFQQAVLDC